MSKLATETTVSSPGYLDADKPLHYVTMHVFRAMTQARGWNRWDGSKLFQGWWAGGSGTTQWVLFFQFRKREITKFTTFMAEGKPIKTEQNRTKSWKSWSKKTQRSEMAMLTILTTHPAQLIPSILIVTSVEPSLTETLGLVKTN